MRKLLSKLILDFGKCPNQKTHESESAGFLVRTLPVVRNQFWKQFSNKVLYNYCSKFFFGAFRSVFKKVKKWIFHCIFKKWFDLGRVLFLTKFFSEKAKHPKICLSFCGSMPEAQIKRCHLTPSPTKWEGIMQTPSIDDSSFGDSGHWAHFAFRSLPSPPPASTYARPVGCSKIGKVLLFMY